MARIEEEVTRKVYLSAEEMERVIGGGVATFSVDGVEYEVGAEPDYFEEENDDLGECVASDSSECACTGSGETGSRFSFACPHHHSSEDCPCTD